MNQPLSVSSRPNGSQNFRILDGLSSVIERYDAIICDIWGVLHNSVALSESAAECLQKARDMGKAVVLLSNAPRPNADIERHLHQLGLRRSAFDRLVTSGDLTIQAFNRDYRNCRFFHLGPDRDQSLVDALQGVKTLDIDVAEVVVCSGFYDENKDSIADYMSLLDRARDCRLTMICANPDLQVMRGDRVVLCAGSIAAAYVEIGGTVCHYGKPYGVAYDQCRNVLEEVVGHAVSLDRLLALGDGLATDILGAMQAGIDTVFMPSAAHPEIAALDIGEGAGRERLSQIFTCRGVAPTMVMRALRW